MLVNLFVVHLLHELHLVINIVWTITSYTVILHLRRWYELRDLLRSENRKTIEFGLEGAFPTRWAMVEGRSCRIEVLDALLYGVFRLPLHLVKRLVSDNWNSLPCRFRLTRLYRHVSQHALIRRLMSFYCEHHG